MRSFLQALLALAAARAAPIITVADALQSLLAVKRCAALWPLDTPWRRRICAEP